MSPKHISINDFTYDLPDERIAKYPLAERDNSKLLIYKNGELNTSIYKHIDDALPADTLLVFNNTRVVEARLIFQKSTGGVIEVFCLEPGEEYADITTAMLQEGSVRWKCLIGGASKWKHGMVLEKEIETPDGFILLKASIAERLSDSFIVELSWTPAHLSFAAMLHEAGMIPLPPYLHRVADENDKTRYQTIYASTDGSVAAPTAGLHFTDHVFNQLAAKGIEKAFVTLHVGAGTFKPVKADKMEDHDMHTEFIDVSLETIEQVIASLNKTIVVVGTTSLRTIETLYWMGVKTLMNPQITQADLPILQWEAYETSTTVSAEEALTAIRNWMIKNGLSRLISKTQILIAPGYSLKIAKGIVTNFHQPQSTLLLLIAAIVGNNWRTIYNYALDNDFRFLSYGDGCLLWNSL